MVFAASTPGALRRVTAVPGVVFSGAVSGYRRAYGTSDDSEAQQRVTASTLVSTVPSPSHARPLWAVGTARDYATVNGVPAHGAMNGPGIYKYWESVRALARSAGADPVPLPVPFGVWDALALLSERLPNAPFTPSQVDLMRLDNVVSGKMPGFDDVHMKPRSLEDALPDLGHIGEI